jgi:hypothetical protein
MKVSQVQWFTISLKEIQYTNEWNMESCTIHQYLPLLDRKGELHFNSFPNSINKSKFIKIKI